MTDSLCWQNSINDTVTVRVTPNAATNRIQAQQVDNSWVIRVYVTAIAEDGKANDAVIKLLAKALNIPKSSLTITRGLTSRNKTLTITRSVN
jgi:uncharacterized protein